MTAPHHKTEARRAGVLRCAAAVALGVLALAGLFSIASDITEIAARARRYLRPTAVGAVIPASILPGPPRTEGPLDYRLDPTNAVRMTGRNDRWNERWADLAGNFYAKTFTSRFSYEATGPDAPQVWVEVGARGTTFSGRLEARHLKPNFVYQIKLRGNYERDPAGAEAIGYAGRWRLPGQGTNYTDAEYQAYPDKTAVEAYILFDFFVTDKNGNATRDFSLDSSLHVLWNAARQRKDARMGDVVTVEIDAGDSQLYVRPKQWSGIERLWAQRERGRYQTPDQIIRLPPRHYDAELVLTEESFHSNDRDGGFWATVFTCPVQFEVTP